MKNSTSFHYTIDLFTQTVDGAGIRTSNSETFTFESDGSLENRKAAIIKAKELHKDLEMNPLYVHPMVAAERNYLNYSCYSLNIRFHKSSNDTEGYIISGEEYEEIAENLSLEAVSYINETNLNVDMTNIDVYDGDDSYEVLQEDLEYLLG